MRNDVLFLTLKIFSATGGIEKVCRIAGKAMYEQSIRYNTRIKIYSMHDDTGAATDNLYFPAEIFKGFSARKISFVKKAIEQGRQSRLVIVSHVNLLLPAYLIKKIAPQTKIVLLAHGIEIWDKLSATQTKMLQYCDEIVSVSQYTSSRIQFIHGVKFKKCSVLNNCLDPFLPLPSCVQVSSLLYKKYHCTAQDKIIFTLTRLSQTEQYKGYDMVLRAIKEINLPGIRYLLAGKYDAAEKEKLQALATELGLQDKLIIAGFVPDDELGALFTMADVYAMPSSKEGFGIVFIEAMYYGLPVIAGNADGSADALLNGALGTLVSPSDIEAVKEAIQKILNHPQHYKPNAALLQQHFSYDNYKEKIDALLDRHLGD